MGKHNNANFLQLNREIFNGRYKDLDYQAKWFYAVLSELEHRFTGAKEDFFFRSNQELVNDTGLSESTIKRRKKKLVDAGLIQTWQMHWQDPQTKKKSEKHITAYRILR